MADRALIDQASLDGLVAAAGGDRSFLAELIDAYLEDSPQQLSAMLHAAQALAPEDLRRAAHSLKSNSASLGAASLAAQCKELEDLARSGALQEMGLRLERVHHEYEEVAQSLREIRAGLST
jgi:HPt (histidine-containing phosphotransfer) domain-containing protein